MHLTDSQIKSATTEKKPLLSDGAGLYLEVRRTHNRHYGQYLIGSNRFSTTAKGSKIDVHIGTYGKGSISFYLAGVRIDHTLLLIFVALNYSTVLTMQFPIQTIRL